MSRTLTDADVAAIAAAITVPHTLDPTVHAEQHAFLQTWMAKEQRRQEFYDSIKKQVGGWLIVTIFTGIGLGAWKIGAWLLHHVRVGQ